MRKKFELTSDAGESGNRNFKRSFGGACGGVWRCLLLRFQVLIAAIMKGTVIWDVTPHSFIEIDRHFRGPFCFHLRPVNGGSKHVSNGLFCMQS